MQVSVYKTIGSILFELSSKLQGHEKILKGFDFGHIQTSAIKLRGPENKYVLLHEK